MIVARLIKYDSELYYKIRERIRFFDTFFLMNPPLFFPIWIMILAGVSVAAAGENPELYWVENISWQAFLLVSGVTLLVGATFVQYQIRNSHADRINQRITLVQEEGMEPEKVRKLITVLAVSGSLLVIGTSVIGGVPMGIVWALLLYFAWGILHNDPKFLWSGRPILSLISHALAATSLFMLGWNHASVGTLSGLFSSLPYVLAFVAWSVMGGVSDLKGDREAEKSTFAVRFGSRPAVVWGTVFLSISMILGYLHHDAVISTSSAVSLPFFLVALAFTRMDHIQRAVRYPVFILAAFVCVRYPWFFLALIVLFYFSKFYYYFRFNVDYPTFHVSHDLPTEPHPE
ncbi:MAG: UbiA family prenyltransferase [Candidatus Neomarinimicrobiota bacterium]